MRYGLLNDIRRLDKTLLPQTVERFIALGLPKANAKPSLCPQPNIQINSDNISSALEQYNLHNDKPILAICPGAEFGASKRWPSKYYAEIVLSMIKTGWQAWLFGSEKDTLIGADIINTIPHQYQQSCQFECHRMYR